MSEVKLSIELKTSRSPIREAFGQLESEGLVKTVRRKGVYVFDFTKKDVLELAELRTLFDKHLLTVLIEEDKVTPKAINDLEAIVKTMRETYLDPALNREAIATKVSELDYLFHMYIVELADRPTFSDLINNILIKCRAIIGIVNLNPNPELAVNDHCRIIEALKQKDLALVEEAVHTHMQTWLRRDLDFQS